MIDKNKLESYRAFAIKAATELYYPESVIEDLEKAETEGRIQIIMATARKRKFRY